MDLLAWLFSADLGRDKLALLVACTLAIHALATNLVWRLFYAGSGRGLVLRLGGSWIGRSMAQIARLLYYVGVPLAVLWRGDHAQMGVPSTLSGVRGGDAVLHLLGLSQAQDLIHVGVGLGMGAGALCVLVALWVWYARAVPDAVGGCETRFVGAPPLRPTVPWWQALREALFLQPFWAFYRSFGATLTSDAVYVAFLGLALVALSWLLDPLRRNGLRSASRGYAIARDWAVALFTAFVAMRVHALWVLILMHSAWLWASDQVLRSVFRFPAGSTSCSYR